MTDGVLSWSAIVIIYLIGGVVGYHLVGDKLSLWSKIGALVVVLVASYLLAFVVQDVPAVKDALGDMNATVVVPAVTVGCILIGAGLNLLI